MRCKLLPSSTINESNRLACGDPARTYNTCSLASEGVKWNDILEVQYCVFSSNHWRFVSPMLCIINITAPLELRITYTSEVEDIQQMTQLYNKREWYCMHRLWITRHHQTSLLVCLTILALFAVCLHRWMKTSQDIRHASTAQVKDSCIYINI